MEDVRKYLEYNFRILPGFLTSIVGGCQTPASISIYGAAAGSYHL
jgi:hypothetical protein